ncbi:uncharacterized protein JCM10292_005536 [Rhodotorula paludigena]|uniref:uncharacterized protein n=1 Tax=Rhodotorula paludigena TaxID=86838 RepID=UPI0031827083
MSEPRSSTASVHAPLDEQQPDLFAHSRFAARTAPLSDDPSLDAHAPSAEQTGVHSAALSKGPAGGSSVRARIAAVERQASEDGDCAAAGRSTPQRRPSLAAVQGQHETSPVPFSVTQDAQGELGALRPASATRASSSNRTSTTSDASIPSAPSYTRPPSAVDSPLLSTPSVSRSTSPTPAPPPASSRTLSSAALAALADSPVRARPRPPLPAKSAARPPSTRISSAYTDETSLSRATSPRSRASSAASSSLPSIANRSSVASIGHTGALLAEAAEEPSAPSPATPVPPEVEPAPSSLAQPRARPPLSTTLSAPRTPSSSRASSAVYTPSSLANGSSWTRASSGGFSTADDMANGSGFDWLTATPATTASYTSPSSSSQASPAVPSQMSAGEDAPPFASSKRAPAVPLRLEPASLAPPSLPTPAQAETLAGLGIGFPPSFASQLPPSSARPSFDGEGEFARELARLSAYAQSLPSPLPPLSAHSQLAPPTEWGELAPPTATAAPTTDDRTLVLPSSTVRPASSGSRATEQAPSPVPALPLRLETQNLAPAPRPRRSAGLRAREASGASSLYSNSPLAERQPSLLSIPAGASRAPILRGQPSLDQLMSPGGMTTDGESFPYPHGFAYGETTDFVETTDVDATEDDEDDEDESFGLPRPALRGSRAPQVPMPAFAGGHGAFSSLEAPSSQESSLVLPSPAIEKAQAGGTASSLWGHDEPAWLGLGIGMNAGADVEPVVEDVVDWSGKAIDRKELPPATTHLILSRCTTPFEIAPLLTLAIPTLLHGLVVLDLGSCGLSEVPSAIAACVFLEELNLSGNSFATGTLPVFLGTLPALALLLADECNLTTLPSSLASLGRLHTLALRNNRLKALPAWLARLGALETLLVDGNPFHWQFQSVIRPLLCAPLADALPTPSPALAPASVPVSRRPSLAPSPHLTPASLAPSPRPMPTSLSPDSAALVTSPPLASPAPFFRSTSATPIYNAFSSPPSQVDLVEAFKASVSSGRDRHASGSVQASVTASPLMSPAVSPPMSPPMSPPLGPSPALSGSESAAATGEKREKRKWGRLLKKVSASRLRSGSNASKPPLVPPPPLRPGALEAESRTFSQPVTRGEESDAERGGGRMFGSVGKKGKRRFGSTRNSAVEGSMALHGDRTAPVSKRRSFLLLDAFVAPPSPRGPSAPSKAPQNYSNALQSILAYLRDLDDLSPASDPSLQPVPPVDSSAFAPPPLRHSPSLGALSPGDSNSAARPASPANAMRRAQSTRRLPSAGSSTAGSMYRSSSFRVSQSYDTDLPDPSEPSPADTAKKPAVDDPVKREAVLNEIVQTEQSYLRGLEELCGIYVASASVPVSGSANGGRKDTVLPSVERRAVFGNIEAIRDFHRKVLLPDLLAANRAGGDSVVVAGHIGDVFVQHASFMKIYSSYINSFDDALARIQTWAKTSGRSRSNTSTSASGSSPALGSLNAFDATAGLPSTLSSSQKKRIKSWLKRCRAHPSHSQISLESYLLLPIQRIPRYRLLLETLLSATPELFPVDAAPVTSSPLAQDALAEPDDPHQVIARAVREMDEVAVTLNESKRENEGRAQLVHWQNRLVTRFRSPLVQPHRTLLRSGNLTLVRAVKRSVVQTEPPLPDPNRPTSEKPAAETAELHTLLQENKHMSLIGLLCTDLLVLVKAPPPPLDQDPNSPVELYTVLRLNSSQPLGAGTPRSEPPASFFGAAGDMIRLKVGDKAICYLQCPGVDKAKARKDSLQWVNAINLQFQVNT